MHPPMLSPELHTQIRQILSDNDREGPHQILRVTQYYNYEYVVVTTNGTIVTGWLMKQDSHGQLFLVQSFGDWIVSE